MARLFNDSTSDGLDLSSTPVSATPLTMCCWYNLDDISVLTSQYPFVISYSVANLEWFMIYLRISTSTIRFLARGGGNEGIAGLDITYETDAWHFVCAVFTSSTSRHGFHDTTKSNTNTTSCTPTVDQIDIASIRGTGGQVSGKTAEHAIWNVALSDDEVYALAKRRRPPTIRPGNLRFYAPLWRDEDEDYIGHNALATNGSPSIGTHPPMIWTPPPVQIWMPKPAAGTDTSDNQPAYTKGQAAAVDNTPAFTQGSLSTSSNKSTFLAGSQDVADNQPAFLVGDAAEYLVPDGDLVVGSWKNESEGSVLWSSIDEDPPPADADYAYYDGASGSESFTVTLSNPVGDPLADGAWEIQWRSGRISGVATIVMKVELMQGVAVIASDQQTITGSFQTFTYKLTSGEKANITDPDDLRLRFTVVSVT